MNAGKIQRIGRVPRYLQHIKKSINPIVDALNKPTGIIVPSANVTARRLPDGRVQPKISGSIAGTGTGAAGGGGGGPYGGNVFVI